MFYEHLDQLIDIADLMLEAAENSYDDVLMACYQLYYSSFEPLIPISIIGQDDDSDDEDEDDEEADDSLKVQQAFESVLEEIKNQTQQTLTLS